MKLAGRIAALFGVMLMVFLTADAIRARSAPSRARAVRIGDSREQVRSKLGRPSAITHGIFNSSETWAYGGYLNWQHLDSLIRFRLFSPDADEVAIQFDDDGKVSGVIIPKRN